MILGATGRRAAAVPKCGSWLFRTPTNLRDRASSPENDIDQGLDVEDIDLAVPVEVCPCGDVR